MNDSAASGQPEYLQAWSLRRQPFEKRLDPQFFYAGSALMQRLDLLTHLVQFGESVVVVSGPPDSGKSSLLEQFLGHINPQWVICLMDGKQGDSLSARLAETIGGAPDDDEQALLARWAAQSEASQHMVVVIDNAEQLDESVCQRLCELTGLPDGDRLRIVLFGKADTEQHIRAALERVSSKRTCQVLEIPKLTEEETASYLMYRLAVAGYSGESPFTLTEVRAMCKAADGRPGKINHLAHESLIEHHMRAKNKNRAPVRRSSKKNTAPLWIGASIAIAAVTGYLGWQRLTPTIEPDNDTTHSEQALLAELSLELPATPLPTDDADDKRATLSESPSREEQVADTPALITEAIDTATPTGSLDGSKSNAASPILTADALKSGATSVAKPENYAVTAAPATSADPVASPDTTTKNTTPTIMEKTSAVAPSAQPLPASTPGQPHREDWLLQQQPASVTLQLLGSRKLSSIEAYIKQNALEPTNTAYYRGRYRDADWYVLLYGIYPDKAAALAARSALPDKIQKAKPWPRSLKSIQDSINEVQ